MRSVFRHNPVRVDEENPYWISFSDLMSALLVIFILAVVALIIQLTETKQEIRKEILELQDAEKARHDILIDIQTELAEHNIFVEIADNHTVLRIPWDTLSFRSDKDYIPTDELTQMKVIEIGLAIHRAILEPLKNSSNKMRFEYLDTVFIEGHTDGQTSKRPKGNWGLATFRAISLWEYWEEELPAELNGGAAFSELENAFGNKLFSVSGYADTRLLTEETALIKDSQEAKNQRKSNRRIDIRFTVKHPTVSDLGDIVAK